MRLSRVRRQPSPITVLALAGAFGAYALVYVLSFPFLGNSAGILLTEPVIASAILFGLRGGTAAGVGSVPVGMVLALGVGGQTVPEWIMDGGGLGSAALLLVGVMVGRLVDLQHVSTGESRLRVAAKDALEESEEKFRGLYNETPVIMYSVGEGHRIIEVNDYWLQVMGYERGEVIGRSSRDFWSEEEREKRDDVHVSSETGPPETSEIQFVTRNGKTIDTMVTVAYDRDDFGTVIQARTSAIDVTERRAAEQALR